MTAPDTAEAAANTVLLRAIETVMGKKPLELVPLLNAGGYTQALRRIVHFSDNTTAFVKAATNDNTTQWIRTERTVYEALNGASFLPAFFGAGETEPEGNGESRPFLLLEDLSGCAWPPPWTPQNVDAVQNALAAACASVSRAPADLPRAEDELAGFASWHLVAGDPAPFLSLGLCGEKWLDAALPDLIAAQNAAPLAGNDLLHLDVRSDNLCFRVGSGKAVLVDWNWACIGNKTLDIAGWLPSLCHEGGPLPETVSPEAGVFAAILSGFWAYRAGTPAPPAAPRVRIIQRKQLEVALPWAARVLGLPPPA